MPTDDLPDNDPGRYTDANGVIDPRRPDAGQGPRPVRAQRQAQHQFGTGTPTPTSAGSAIAITSRISATASYGISAYSIRSDAGLYGRGRYWEASLMADHYQLADYTLTEANLPYDRLPRAYVHWAQPFAHLAEAGIDSEAVRFQHDENGGGSRLDVKPYISMPLEGASWFLLPKLAWRYTGYQLDSDTAATVATSRAQQFATDNGIAYTPALDAQFLTAPDRSLPITSRRCRPVLRPQHHDPRRPLPAYAGTADLSTSTRPSATRTDRRCSTPVDDLQLGPAVPRQPLHRRRPPDRRQPAHRRADHAPDQRGRRPRAAVGQHRPDPLFRRQPGHHARASPRSSRASRPGSPTAAFRPATAGPSARPTSGTRSSRRRT